MDDQAALERVIRRTGHERFRDLVRERPEYWDVVRAWDGQAIPEPTPAQRRAAKPRMPLGSPQKPPPGCRTCGG